MARIELRPDGWFDAGKDAPYRVMREIYAGKQELKQKLSAIPQGPFEHLEAELMRIPAPEGFDGRPHLDKRDIYIKTHGPPGQAYLGSIKE